MLATLDANVMVALFAFLTAVVTVVVPQMMRRMKRTEQHAEEIKEAIGVKNGNGDAMQMMAKTLGAQYELMRRMEDHEELDTRRFTSIDGSIESLSGQVAQATSAAASAAQAAASTAQTASELVASVAEKLKAKDDEAAKGR